MISLNNNWIFCEQWKDEFRYGVTGQPVRLPHSSRMLGYHYINEKDYQMICGYSKEIEFNHDLGGRKSSCSLTGLLILRQSMLTETSGECIREAIRHSALK